jgi:phosphoglucosamine mutase
MRIEQHLDEPPVTSASSKLGRAMRVDKSRTRYQEFCISTVPGLDLTGMKVVIDCANGAGLQSRAAHPRGPQRGDRADRLLAERPQHQSELRLHSPELLQLTVPGVQAQAGIALDGDGDRLVMVDHLGRLVDGDQLLYIIARAAQGAEAAGRASRRHRDEQSRAWSMRSRRRASSSAAPRSAIVTCWRC